MVDADGRFFAFEIDNIYIGPRMVATILSAVEGVTEVRQRKLFRSPSDVHVSFKYNGKEYMVWEPWGDSSRYWIGPEKDDIKDDITSIAAALEHYDPPVVVRWLGDVMTLNFRALWRSG
jgi:hypothetical protein